MDFHLVRSRLSLSPETALVACGILLPLIPVALTVLSFWKRKTWRPNLAGWRWRVWHVGLILGALAATAVPVFLLGLQFLSDKAKQGWFIEVGGKGMFFAFLIAPVALIMFGFGGGRQRWVGMLSAALSFVLLYISLLAASY